MLRDNWTFLTKGQNLVFWLINSNLSLLFNIHNRSYIGLQLNLKINQHLNDHDRNISYNCYPSDLIRIKGISIILNNKYL